MPDATTVAGAVSTGGGQGGGARNDDGFPFVSINDFDDFGLGGDDDDDDSSSDGDGDSASGAVGGMDRLLLRTRTMVFGTGILGVWGLVGLVSVVAVFGVGW